MKFSAHLSILLLSLISISHSLDPLATTTGNALTTNTPTTLPIAKTKTDTTAMAAGPHYVPIKTPTTTIEPTHVTVEDLGKLTTVDLNTYVWITITQNGLPVAISSAYVQQFTKMYDTIETWSSGTIGLGSIHGEIGTTKTYRVVPYVYY